MTSAEPRLLLIGNPTTVSGAFHRAFHQERHLYHTITISALDSPNGQREESGGPGIDLGQVGGRTKRKPGAKKTLSTGLGC